MMGAWRTWRTMVSHLQRKDLEWNRAVDIQRVYRGSVDREYVSRVRAHKRAEEERRALVRPILRCLECPCDDVMVHHPTATGEVSSEASQGCAAAGAAAKSTGQGYHHGRRALLHELQRPAQVVGHAQERGHQVQAAAVQALVPAVRWVSQRTPCALAPALRLLTCAVTCAQRHATGHRHLEAVLTQTRRSAGLRTRPLEASTVRAPHSRWCVLATACRATLTWVWPGALIRAKQLDLERKAALRRVKSAAMIKLKALTRLTGLQLKVSKVKKVPVNVHEKFDIEGTDRGVLKRQATERALRLEVRRRVW